MLNLKQIEKLVDPIVLDYLKEMCLEKQYRDTEIELIEVAETTKKYRSIMVYDYVLNEIAYQKNLMNYYHENLHKEIVVEKEKKKRKKREIGKSITKSEALAIIFSDNFEHRRNELDKKGRRIGMKAFVANIDRETQLIEDKAVVHNLNKMIEKTSKYRSFTGNLFYHHKHFTKEMLALLHVIVLDFDLDKAGLVMSKEEVFKLVKKKLGIELSMIWDTNTNGNYQAAILIENMTGHIQSVHLYEAISNEICYQLGKAVDKSCASANHMFTVPQNNKRKGRTIRLYNEKRYNIDEFRFLLKERDERRKKEESTNQGVVNFTKKAVENHPAIQALLHADNINFRNHACFTLSLLLKFLDYNEEEATNYILGYWRPKVDVVSVYGERFTEREATKIIKRVYSDRYKNFHSKWVEICTGIECNLSGYFRSRSKYIGEVQYKTKNEQELLLFFEKNKVFEGTRAELAEATNINELTLKKIIAKLKKDGVLAFETKRGKGSKTRYELIQSSELAVFQKDKIQNIDEEMAIVANLEEQMLLINV